MIELKSQPLRIDPGQGLSEQCPSICDGELCFCARLEMLARNVMAAAAVLMTNLFSTANAEVILRERLAEGQAPVIGSWRATGGGYPESAFAGIKHSLDIGAEIIDLHVQLTGHRQHIVFHHARLDHSTNVQSVFPDGPPGGPSRLERGGLDYTRDYTLQEIQQLRLIADGEVTSHQIPTLDEALSLVGGACLVVLNLQEFHLEGLKSLLANHPTGNLLAYGVDPQVVRAVVSATGVAGYANLSQTRLFESETPLQILEAWAEVIGEDLALAHVKRVRQITPELLQRAEQLSVRLSVSGY